MSVLWLYSLRRMFFNPFYSKKGKTIRVKVTSADPVDVRLCIAQPRGKWMPIEFPTRKQGDEVTHYQCDRTLVYKVYARPAGSAGEWVKPLGRSSKSWLIWQDA